MPQIARRPADANEKILNNLSLYHGGPELIKSFIKILNFLEMFRSADVSYDVVKSVLCHLIYQRKLIIQDALKSNSPLRKISSFNLSSLTKQIVLVKA